MYIPSVSRERGASVLAALVVAAVLASIGIAVQETGPVALSDHKALTAESGIVIMNNPAPVNVTPTSQTKSNITPEPGYDYVLDANSKPIPHFRCRIPGKAEESSNKPYPPENKLTETDWSNNGTHCVAVQTGMQAGSDWKSIVKYNCSKKTTSGWWGTKEEETCLYYYADKKTEVVSQGKEGAVDANTKVLADAAEKGDTNAAQELKNRALKGDAAAQQALDGAYKKVDDSQKTLDSQMNELSKEAQSTAQALNQLGCYEDGASTDLNCRALLQKNDVIEKKWQDLTAESKKLADTKVALDIPQCEPGSPGCYNVPNPNAKTDNPDTGKVCPPGTIGTPPTCSAPGYNNPNTTFGPSTGTGGQCSQADKQSCLSNPDNNPACMRCSGSNGNMPRPGQGGGQKGGGGAGGGQQQPQCQPKYFCNGNTLMYAPCANNQPNNAQSVQQCPTGYACQATSGSANSSCQPSAPYGYCADGRTPRTAQAQQQPPASSCTVGAWQDTSNGCQTSWQCIAGASNTSQPTAQLSCQPKNAVSGMTINFSYACANGATSAVATGFSLPTSAPLAGTATTSAVKPAGTQTVVYSLTCSNASSTPALTASAQCSVQVGNPTIVVVATPEQIEKNETEEAKRKSAIGWVPTGMRACRVSSPSFEVWTNDQSSNTSIAGVAVTPVITADTSFFVACETLGGTTATSSVKVLAI